MVNFSTILEILGMSYCCEVVFTKKSQNTYDLKFKYLFPKHIHLYTQLLEKETGVIGLDCFHINGEGMSPISK